MASTKLKNVRGKFKVKSIDSFNKDIRQTLSKVLANDAKNWYREGFRKGGGQTDDFQSGWQPRKTRGSSRAILVKSGKLVRDIKVRSTRMENIVVGTSGLTNPYAIVHNEGLKAGRGQGFQMPKREFIGFSTKLEQKNKEKIEKKLKKLLE